MTTLPTFVVCGPDMLLHEIPFPATLMTKLELWLSSPKNDILTDIQRYCVESTELFVGRSMQVVTLSSSAKPITVTKGCVRDEFPYRRRELGPVYYNKWRLL